VNPEIIGISAILILLLLMFLAMPIWISMLVVGLAGFTFLSGWHQATNMMAQNAIGALQNYAFAVLPVFLLMGELADVSRMMTDAFRSIVVWAGKLPGGLAMASVLGAAGFSCVSGSSLATVALMTNVALPQLLDAKYDRRLAVGALAAGGTLGNLIPPGGLLIIYAILSDVSIGQFFIACYIPGFLLTFMYLVQIYVQCKLKPSLVPVATSSTWKQKFVATKGLIAILVVFLIIMGGIQFGVFTPNEAASIATVFIFFYALLRRTLNGQNLLRSLKSTLVVTGMAMAVIIGANILNVFIAVSGLATALSEWLVSLHVSGLVLVILIMIVYFILGIAMDPTSMLLLTLPILLPVLNTFHVNLLWFGVLAIIQCELGNLTPPVGLNLFVVAAAAKPKGIQMSDVFRGAIPFCITCAIFLVICVAFPQISLFLVNLMKT
jgi:C4-dicarboxylate transporter, DctM subunit